MPNLTALLEHARALRNAGFSGVKIEATFEDEGEGLPIELVQFFDSVQVPFTVGRKLVEGSQDTWRYMVAIEL